MDPKIQSIEVAKSVLTLGGHDVVVREDSVPPLLNETDLASPDADILRKKRKNLDAII